MVTHVALLQWWGLYQIHETLNQTLRQSSWSLTGKTNAKNLHCGKTPLNLIPLHTLYKCVYFSNSLSLSLFLCVCVSMMEYDTENMNSEEIYSSLRGVTEAIQSFSYRSQEDLNEPIRREGKRDDAVSPNLLIFWQFTWMFKSGKG